jgi:hypothetical protein
MTSASRVLGLARWLQALSRLALVAAVLAVAAPDWLCGTARAEPSPEDRETARALLLDGRAKFDAGDFRGALKAFDAAHDIMGVPTTALDLAKTQLALTLLVEARATLRQAMLYPVAENEPDAFTRARAQAVELERQVVGRIPSLVITAAPENATIAVDGVRIPAAATHLPRTVNPGRHVVTASAEGYRSASKTVEVAEGARAEVEFELEVDTSRPAPRKKPKPDAIGSDDDDGSVPAWAWAVGATGIAFTAVSIGFAVDYASANDTIGSDCAARNQAGEPVCDPARYNLDDATALFERRDRSGAIAIAFGAAGVACLTASVIGIAIGVSGDGTATSRTPLTLGTRGTDLIVSGAF